MGYVKCKNQGWVGNCYDCLRRCEGQHKWPEDMCYDPREQNDTDAHDPQG